MEWTVGQSYYNRNKGKSLEEELGSPQRPKEPPKRPRSSQNGGSAPQQGGNAQTASERPEAGGGWLFYPLSRDSRSSGMANKDSTRNEVQKGWEQMPSPPLPSL